MTKPLSAIVYCSWFLQLIVQRRARSQILNYRIRKPASNADQNLGPPWVSFWSGSEIIKYKEDGYNMAMTPATRPTAPIAIPDAPNEVAALAVVLGAAADEGAVWPRQRLVR